MVHKRIAGLLAIFLIGASGLISRLFEVSFVQHGQWVYAATQQQNATIQIEPQRGRVWLADAATGKNDLIAENVRTYAVSATPINVTKKEAYAQVLATDTGVDQAALLSRFQANGKYMNPIKTNLSQADVRKIGDDLNVVELTANNKWKTHDVNFGVQDGQIINFIGGVYFIPQYSTTYPEGSLGSQVLGFINSAGTGQYGIEGKFDTQLKGTSGTIFTETDSSGNLLQQVGGTPEQDGTSYQLSIDKNVQYTVEQDLVDEVRSSSASGGSAIVMNVKTGEVVAMANTPTFDPNTYRSVRPDQIGSFGNPTISGSWEPGSIFKDLIMGAALNEGLVAPDTTNTFDESVTVQGYKIETALRRAYGTENMSQVLANSDNVAMVWIANKLGNDKMYQYLQSFGLGQKTGVDLSGEISGGILPLSKWKDINRATISFGQGIAVTPLQILTAYAAIANKGRIIQPHVVHANVDNLGQTHVVQPTYGAQVLKPEVAQQVLAMMQYTVDTADKKAGIPGFKIGGKTGTAQIPDPINGGYFPNAYNHSFVGVDTVDNPNYVILVKVDNPDVARVGLYAEDTAVPLFNRINSFLLNYYQTHPSIGQAGASNPGPPPSAPPVTPSQP